MKRVYLLLYLIVLRALLLSSHTLYHLLPEIFLIRLLCRTDVVHHRATVRYIHVIMTVESHFRELLNIPTPADYTTIFIFYILLIFLSKSESSFYVRFLSKVEDPVNSHI